MDEEDIREAEESQALNTANDFTGFGTAHDAVIKASAIDIFRPSNETIGTKLLKKMGWREGQGIGPRIRRAAKLDDEDNDQVETHLFAPDEVHVAPISRKTDCKGLGYEGEVQEQKYESNGTGKSSNEAAALDEGTDKEILGPLSGTKKKGASVKKRAAFGVGILNDDGSGDEDPYSMGPKISYNKTIGGDKKSKAKPKVSTGTANPLVRHKPTFISKKLANLKGALRKCHDGRLPLDGFSLADELDSFGSMSLQDHKYKPPEVPEDWKSSLSQDSHDDNPSTFVSTAEAARSSSMTAKARSSLLGEAQLPGKSVFDYLTPASRDRLVVASGRQTLPAAGSEIGPSAHETAKSETEVLLSLIPGLDQTVALQALKRGTEGWMPYAEDESKRSRYRIYLEIQAGLRPAGEIPPRADHMRRDDWVLEMQEFARAAEVFKPISGPMASRFTSSSSTPKGRDDVSGEASTDALLSKPRTKPDSPAEAAAKLGMFGPMTRSILNFYPTRLLCKRFGVSMPIQEKPGNEGSASSAFSSAEPHLAATQFRSFTSAGYQHEETLEVKQTEIETSSSTIKQEAEVLDPDRNEALEQTRPGQDVFKAIFGSDDEEDD